MKKIIFLLVLFSCTGFLLAQPEIDTVHPGIRSVKKWICGYNGYSDSTGLKLEEMREYNLKGQPTKYIRRMQVNSVSENNPDVEPEAEAYYYEIQRYVDPKREYDTTKYQYNAKFQLIKYSSRDYQNKIWKAVYAYDEKGNCISELFTRGGVEEYRYSWKYNERGDLLTKSKTVPGKNPELKEKRSYDSNNRLSQIISFGYYPDSTVYNYYETGKQVSVFHKTGSIDRTFYDENDSLISSVRFFNTRNKNGDYSLKIFDSTYVSRAKNGFRDSSYTITFYYDETAVKKSRYDDKGRLTEEITNINGENTRRIAYLYNDSLHMIVYNRFGIYHDKTKSSIYGKEDLKEEEIYFYDAKNRLIETRRKNGNHTLLERTIYQYSYY